MKLALTYNLRLSDSPDEAEFDTEATIASLARAINACGHEVELVEVSGPASRLASRLEAYNPDLIFNVAEGKRGRTREAFYPALFDELGFPYTGSDAYALTLTLDKGLTKRLLAPYGVASPRGRFVTRAALSAGVLDDVVFPAIVKPNFEGSSKGISDDSLAEDPSDLARVVDELLVTFPHGVLVEQYIPGRDITVPLVEGIGDGILGAVDYVVDPSYARRYDLYDYTLKNLSPDLVTTRCPAELSPELTSRVRELARRAFRALDVRDLGRADFRLGRDGRLYFLELNALPMLAPGTAIPVACAAGSASFATNGSVYCGVDYNGLVAAVIASAARRYHLHHLIGVDRGRPSQPKTPRRGLGSLRIGFAYNIKRVDTHDGNDAEAEYDPPSTIDAIKSAIESYGHVVVPLEANVEFPKALADSNVDLVFNIAEGLRGRNREGMVPSLCELLGIPYTGSDSATLSIALDKALAKRVMRQHGVTTPEFQLMVTGRERLARNLRFPLIVKPNAEGSSKGIGDKSVVDDEEQLRSSVRNIVERYRQPALIEEYIHGREFTVGLLGDKRPRILAPMEIVFLDKQVARPVYDFVIKQDWEKFVAYHCPAELTVDQRKAIEKAARDTFVALDCRDVARVDLRMDGQGKVYVIEVNPLPGLTPDYSDLVLITKALGMPYRSLIGEIFSGAIKRLKEKRATEKVGGDAVQLVLPGQSVGATPSAGDGHPVGNGASPDEASPNGATQNGSAANPGATSTPALP